MADNPEIKVIKNERGIVTGEARTGVEPRPNADGSLPPMSNARNPIVTDPAGKTPGSAESGGQDQEPRSEPGKTPGNAEG
jgi:hypothetical protein